MTEPTNMNTPKSADDTQNHVTREGHELTGEQLDEAVGGFNPQPDPPGKAPSKSIGG